METLFEQFAISMNGFNFKSHSSVPLHSNQNFVKESAADQYIDPSNLSANLHHTSDSSTSMNHISELGDWFDNSESNPVLKFISEMLLKEDL